jgi:hypothetical protein
VPHTALTSAASLSEVFPGELRMTDTTKATATATCREFIKLGGTLAQWLQVYGYVASQLSDNDLALSKLNSGEDKMWHELERLCGVKLPPKK